MARPATNNGVEIRDNSIRIAFTWQGQVCRETLRIDGRLMAPTKANISFATRLSKEVRHALKAGTFVYADHFPDSKRVQPTALATTFGALADLWLDSKGGLEAATRDQYALAVAMWKKKFGADKPLRELTHQVIAAEIGRSPWASAKSLNNYLIVLRGIMRFHYRGPLASANPMDGIENRPGVKPQVDPLSVEERDRVLAELSRRYDPRVWAYFQFAFFTGMRPEELIALQWGDLDFASGVARVQRVRTFRGTERAGSKTHSIRDVDLVTPASAALDAMRPFTELKAPYVFENPVTGSPWHDERSQRDHYWTPTLKRLGIRYRRSYCTRHTYATVALMRGVNPAYIARQMGHRDAKMLFERYARWIDGADKGVQRSALEAAMGDFSPISPQQYLADRKPLIDNKIVGRRDWIRTNQKGK